MSLLRPFTAQDLFSVNPINLDAWTETYGVSYYLGYLNNWGECFSVVTTANSNELMGYGQSSFSYSLATTRRALNDGAMTDIDPARIVMGKTEGVKEDWQ